MRNILFSLIFNLQLYNSKDKFCYYTHIDDLPRVHVCIFHDYSPIIIMYAFRQPWINLKPSEHVNLVQHKSSLIQYIIDVSVTVNHNGIFPAM